jgi:uncharacterized membrane protein
MVVDNAMVAALRFSRGRDPGMWIGMLILAALFYLLVRRLEGDEEAEAMVILPIPLMAGFFGSLSFAGDHDGVTAWLSFAAIASLTTWVLSSFWLKLGTRERLLLAALLPPLAIGCALLGKWIGSGVLRFLS